MSQEETEKKPSTPDVTQSPYSEAGLTSIIISIATICIHDDTAKSLIVIAAPLIGYGVFAYHRKRKAKKNIERGCIAIDNSIARLRAANRDPNTPPAEREENEREIIRLNKLRTDTELKQYEVK